MTRLLYRYPYRQFNTYRERLSVMEEKQGKTERRTLNLWPDVGRQLGLSKNAVYEAAHKGQVPGAFRIGSRWLVSIEAFEKALQTGRPA